MVTPQQTAKRLAKWRRGEGPKVTDYDDFRQSDWLNYIEWLVRRGQLDIESFNRIRATDGEGRFDSGRSH